jgi:hypothetical protein
VTLRFDGTTLLTDPVYSDRLIVSFERDRTRRR